MTIMSGQRVAGFLVLIDVDDCRHAVRLSAIQSLGDADSCRDTTLMTLPGRRQVTLPHRLDDVLKWISQ